MQNNEEFVVPIVLTPLHNIQLLSEEYKGINYVRKNCTEFLKIVLRVVSTLHNTLTSYVLAWPLAKGQTCVV
jgi:hypothetical protein